MVKYQGPRTTVDAVILEPKDSIILIKRKYPPYPDHWALPGGFVELGERVEDAVRREVKEEIGLSVDIIKLIGVFSDPARDPRGHVISIAYLCKRTNRTDVLKAGDEIKEIKIFSRDQIPTSQLGFDHEKIIFDALIIADKESLW
ncbi:MAG: NUDIX domain-containing protein [Candidatus Helarchaeota archaeon]